MYYAVDALADDLRELGLRQLTSPAWAEHTCKETDAWFIYERGAGGRHFCSGSVAAPETLGLRPPTYAQIAALKSTPAPEPASAPGQAPTYAQPRATYAAGPSGAVRLIGVRPNQPGFRSLGLYFKESDGVYVKSGDHTWAMWRVHDTANKYRWHVGSRTSVGQYVVPKGGEAKSDANTSLLPEQAVGMWATYDRSRNQWLYAPELVCVSEEDYQQTGSTITGAMVNIVFHAYADVHDKDVQLTMCYDLSERYDPAVQLNIVEHAMELPMVPREETMKYLPYHFVSEPLSVPRKGVFSYRIGISATRSKNVFWSETEFTYATESPYGQVTTKPREVKVPASTPAGSTIHVFDTQVHHGPRNASKPSKLIWFHQSWNSNDNTPVKKIYLSILKHAHASNLSLESCVDEVRQLFAKCQCGPVDEQISNYLKSVDFKPSALALALILVAMGLKMAGQIRIMIDDKKLHDVHEKWEWLLKQLASDVPSVTDEMPAVVVNGLMAVVRNGCTLIPFTWMQLLAWGIDMGAIKADLEFRNYQLSPTLDITPPHGLKPFQRFTYTFFGDFDRAFTAPAHLAAYARLQVEVPAVAYERSFLNGLAAAEKVMYLLPPAKLQQLFEVLLNCAPTLHALCQLATTEFRVANGVLHLQHPSGAMLQDGLRSSGQRILDGAPTGRDDWKAPFDQIADAFDKLPFLKPEFQRALARIELPAYERDPVTVAKCYDLHKNRQCADEFLRTTLYNEAVIERVPHLLELFYASDTRLPDLRTQETVEHWVKHVSGQDKSSNLHSLSHLFFVVFRDWEVWRAASPVAIDTLTKQVRGLSSMSVSVLLPAVCVAGENSGFADSALFTQHLYPFAIEERLQNKLNVSMDRLSEMALDIFKNLTWSHGDTVKVPNKASAMVVKKLLDRLEAQKILGSDSDAPAIFERLLNFEDFFLPFLQQYMVEECSAEIQGHVIFMGPQRAIEYFAELLKGGMVKIATVRKILLDENKPFDLILRCGTRSPTRMRAQSPSPPTLSGTSRRRVSTRKITTCPGSSCSWRISN
jgi:hypothetical protein